MSEPRKKIPYDNEPIIRQTQVKKSRGSSANHVSSGGGSGRGFVALLLCILLVFNVILAIVVFGRDTGEKVVNNIEYNISSQSIDVSAVVSKALPSVVRIGSGLPKKSGGVTIDQSELNEEYFGQMSEMGSGVIFADDKTAGKAYIVTCNHVLPYPNEVYVQLYDSGKFIKAQKVDGTAQYDVAVLEITSEEYTLSRAKPCTTYDSNYLAVGEPVVAIGNPFGDGFSVTDGIISTLNEDVVSQGSTYRTNRISSPINGGNSGGGLFNAVGEYIGTIAIKKTGANVDCVAYAFSGNLVMNIAENILRTRRLNKAYIGLTLEAKPELKESLVLENGREILYNKVVVGRVDGQSPADLAGIKEGDRIVSLSFNGKTYNMISPYMLEEYSFSMTTDMVITLTIERDVAGRVEKMEKSLTILNTPSVVI